MSYFSQQQFWEFARGEKGRLRLEWLALTGRIFTEHEKEELRRRLEDFFVTNPPEKTLGRQILETFWAEDRIR